MIPRIARLAGWFSILALVTNIAAPLELQAAGTAPGTQITNSASAVYKDAAGNQYSTVSNTVTTTVQNAPTLTNTAGGGAPYAPGQTVTDTFTLSNTGNAAGTLQVSGNSSAPTSSSDAVIAGTDSTYATPGNGGTTCVTPVGSQAAPCKYAVTIGGTTTYFTSLDGTTDNNSLDYWLANTDPATAAGSSIIVSVYYVMSNAAPTSKTVTSTVFATVDYPAAGSAPTQLSSSVSATESNTIIADARLDLYKSSVRDGTTGAITYTISVHNGGAFAAKNLQSAQTLVGAAAPGILISDKVPQFGGAPLALANSGTVTVTTNATYGYAAGATADTYYTTSASGTAGWTKATGALPTDGSVTYIGVFVHGGTCGTAGFELCADTGHPTLEGDVSVASAAAVQISFVVVEATGPGSANAGSVKNLANAVAGDNQPTEHIIGPGIPGGTADGPASTQLTTSGQGVNNTTVIPGNGASNQTSDSALAQYAPLNGPLGIPGSSGTYDGVALNTTADDFTAFPFGLVGDSVQNTGTIPGTPATTATLGTGGQTVCVPNTVKNNGNKDDSFNIVANVPTAYTIPATSGGTVVSGWKVGVYSDAVCTAALGGASDASPSSTAANVAVTSGSSLNYYVKYVIPAGAPYFTRFDAKITATSVASSSASNDTHNELYSAFIALTKSQSVTSNGCPPGVAPSYLAGTICPTGVLQYVVDYRNLVMGTSDTNVSFSSVVTQAGSLQINDDGSLSTVSNTTTPNWATFATINAAPTDTTAATTYTYYSGFPASGGGSPTFATTSTKVVGTVGGASFQLVPANYLAPSGTQGHQGTITFSVTIK